MTQGTKGGRIEVPLQGYFQVGELSWTRANVQLSSSGMKVLR